MNGAQPSYVELAARAGLAEIVRCVWAYRSNGAEGADQHIPPDGCTEFVLHLGAPYRERGADGALLEQPRALFAGQLTRPLVLSAAGEVVALGVRFEPDGAAGFFGGALSAATDRRVDLSARAGVAALLAAAAAAADDMARLALMQDYVAAAPRAPDDAAVRAAVAAIGRGEAVDRAALSERQLQRRFKLRVGVSPRELASQLRFRRVFDAIEAPGAGGWLAAALAAGYFDQAQMARDFRRYLGCTAREWAQAKLGLAGLIAGAGNVQDRG